MIGLTLMFTVVFTSYQKALKKFGDSNVLAVCLLLACVTTIIRAFPAPQNKY